MTLREYNAFLVNNRDKLVDLFSEISENEIGEIKETGVLASDWSIPPYQYYKQHASPAEVSKIEITSAVHAPPLTIPFGLASW